MDLLEAKIFSIATLGLSSILVGFLPLCFFANRGRQLWPLCLSSLLCFGAGVLLATSLVHILPELREVVPNGYKQYSELVFCLGFFILYVLDEIVHYFYGETHELTGLHNLQPHAPNGNSRRHSASSKNSYGATERDGLLHQEKRLPYNPAFYRARSDSVLFCDEPPSQLCHVGHQEPCNAAPTANIGLLTALSVHALLEGLVVGLEAEPTKVLLLLGAIASHKLVVAFCLGMELASNPSYTRRRLLIYIFIFSFGSVAGIIIGMIISNIPSEFKNVAMPVLQGLAGGTLLYVTVSEVLPRERARWHKQHDKRAAGIFQCLSVLLGFILMATLSKYLDYDE